MKRAITLVTFTQLLFLLFLALSGICEGVLSEVIYYCAFLMPATLGLYLIGRAKKDGGKSVNLGLKLTRDRGLSLIPLIFPTVFVIFTISFLTSAFMRWLGFSDSISISEGLPLALVVHALIPAILEELLFRYIPLKLLLPYSPRWAVLLSSLYFALIHGSLFQIPYAFVAGLIFALIDIYSDSILPSAVLHFINNALSLVYMLKLQGSGQVIFFIMMGGLALISAVVIIVRRRSYADLFTPLGDEGLKAEYSLAPLALIIPTLVLAVTNLF